MTNGDGQRPKTPGGCVMPPPIVAQGILGWGNRKTGLEPYGMDGRWGNGREGDLLGDALERAGATEGGSLVVVVLPRWSATFVDDVEVAVRALVEKMDADAVDLAKLAEPS